MGHIHPKWCPISALFVTSVSGTARTFDDYCEQIFKPHLKQMLQTVHILDIIWDVYVTNSLKSTERNQRRKAVRRRVKPATNIPGNWESFQRNYENKTKL